MRLNQRGSLDPDLIFLADIFCGMFPENIGISRMGGWIQEDGPTVGSADFPLFFQGVQIPANRHVRDMQQFRDFLHGKLHFLVEQLLNILNSLFSLVGHSSVESR